MHSYLVDVQTKRYHIIKMTDQIAEYWEKILKWENTKSEMIFYIYQEYRAEKMYGITTSGIIGVCRYQYKEERLGETATHEFTDKISGWNRSRFIPVDHMKMELLHTLLY